MRLLDLFCGAGGAAMGYSQAGFTEILGVDIEPQPNYPFEFYRADVRDLSAFWVWGSQFDLIHGSPPCQGYSANMGHHVTRDYPLLIEEVRALARGIPYVIENVRGAPLPNASMLCGSAFGLRVWRHRYFETSFPLLVPPCSHVGAPLNPYRATSRRRDGLEKGAMRAYGNAMGIDWMTRTAEITEAIPPVYTKFIGEQFLAQVAA